MRPVTSRFTWLDSVNFLLTNRIPRRWATLLMARFSRIEHPVVRALSIAAWKSFATDLRLHEAKKVHFSSLHDCFTRELKDGVRPVDTDPETVISPCDGIVGAHGQIEGTEVFQAKGFPYKLRDLLTDSHLVEKYRNGIFVTLRLKSSMYHRFHAPYDCRISEVVYVSGDTWNVNPIALERVAKLFCRNERVVLDLQLPTAGESLALVPVAAILVASIQLNFLSDALDLQYRGPNRIACQHAFSKGDEMGFFQHGSTIIVFGSGNFVIADGVSDGATIRMGQPLLRHI